MENLTEILKGILEVCVLEIISREETYVYEIVQKLNTIGFEDIVGGTVYTILFGLEKQACGYTEKIVGNRATEKVLLTQ